MLVSDLGSMLRFADRLGNSTAVLSLVLGRGGSSSRMTRKTSSIATFFSSSFRNGVLPESNSYRSTPSEYTSLRVSISKLFRLACSGDMYSGVPTTWFTPVFSSESTRLAPVALATPKSITFGTGRSSTIVTNTFDGLISRWMIPFWWAC